MTAVIIGKEPKVNVVDLKKDQLRVVYAEMLLKNDLLRRIEVTKKAQGWTDLEVRTVQLQAAVNSNASLQGRIKDMEAELVQLRHLTSLKGSF